MLLEKAKINNLSHAVSIPGAAAWPNFMTRKCLICGKEFSPTLNQIKRGVGKFCSKECGYSSRVKKLNRTCMVCGTEFVSSVCQVKRGGGLYCSLKCLGIKNGRTQIGPNNKMWKGGLESVTCFVCGKVFPRSKSARKYAHVFCSTKCRGELQSKRQSGRLSHRWKGGITPLHALIRTTKNYETWRDSVFIRDNFTCAKCHIKGGTLNAHHIKRLSEIISEAKYDVFSHPQIWDVKNGITLCVKCHKLEHKSKEIK